MAAAADLKRGNGRVSMPQDGDRDQMGRWRLADLALKVHPLFVPPMDSGEELNLPPNHPKSISVSFLHANCTLIPV